MAENKNIKNVEELDLEKIAGGTVTDEEIEAQRQKMQEGLEEVGKVADNFFNSLEAISEAIKTNICPICKQEIIPGATKCKAADFLKHGRVAHGAK